MKASFATPDTGSPVLVVDAGSPVVSVAAGPLGGPAHTHRAIEIRRSSEALLGTIEAVLDEAGIGRAELGGLVGVLGPGSFTGLRVGMATLLGLHQALGCAATGIGTFQLLARIDRVAPRALCVVDALRNEWFARESEGSGLLQETELLTADEVVERDPAAIVGHGIDTLVERLPETVEAVTATALAPLAFDLLAESPISWDPGLLLAPRYLRAPAVSTPR